jgi:hypothetical protein
VSTESQQEKKQGVWGPGTLLADRYEIKDVVEAPGTCRLYRARDVFRSTSHLIVGPGHRAREQEGGLIWFEESFVLHIHRLIALPPLPSSAGLSQNDGRPRMSSGLSSRCPASTDGWSTAHSAPACALSALAVQGLPREESGRIMGRSRAMHNRASAIPEGSEDKCRTST